MVYAQAHKWGANHPFAVTTQEVTGIATMLKASLSMFNIAAAKQLVRLVDWQDLSFLEDTMVIMHISLA